ncbi:hypothetical protein CCACVL1_15465 [Corchorus capsularis]|uniref:DUF4220 domain-containing protein n=1 Tax=Corchorus capsularis TaxID=210143 RepID=A0A1R3I2E5_COCAP|nr:hypothetical protein CCACVL1_15465 [Corchorus capsularis]
MVSVNITFTNALQLSHNALVKRLALIELWVFLAMVAIAILIVCGTARRRRRVEERDQAFRMASKSSIARNTKLIADFMATEHDISIEDELDHEVITIKKIWRCKGRLLSPTGDPEHRLKDICLSFALYRLLCRRFGGYPFAECKLEKTWDLIRYGLLSKEEDYERAFRVVEEELSFLFDLFYTKYAVMFKEGGYKLLKSRAADLVFFIIGCLVAINILRDYKPSDDDFNLFTAGGRVNIDKLLTGVVIIGICIMEIIQLILIMVSNWSKVMWICRLLPSHAVVTEFIFDQEVKEARKLLEGCKSESEKYERLMNLCQGGEVIEDNSTLTERGALLAKYLIQHIEDESFTWKVLADFWAELMLFVAPSDDVTAHAQHLAKGGEFITHLWPLLSHAGILKQD